MRGILCTQDRSISGRDKTGPVPLSRHSLLHFCADGLQVPGHPGAARACAARMREEAASHARTSRYGTVKLKAQAMCCHLFASLGSDLVSHILF